MVARGKTKQKVVVAIARELLAFMWAIGVEVEKQVASKNPHRSRGEALDGRPLFEVSAQESFPQRVYRGDERSRDRGRASAAVGLDYVAVEGESSLGHGAKIERRS